MSNFNMTGESDFEGNEAFLKKNRPYNLTWLDVFWLASYFIGWALAFWLLYCNYVLNDQISKQGNLRAKVAEQDTLIRDLKTVLDDDLKIHHAKQGK